MMGLVLVWSTPGVLRMEGLSEWGLKRVALERRVLVVWTVAAARPVTNAIGGSWMGG